MLDPVFSDGGDVVPPARSRHASVAHHEQREEEGDDLSCVGSDRARRSSCLQLPHQVPYTGGKLDEEMGTHLLFQDRVGHWVRRRGAHIGAGRCSTWHTPTKENAGWTVSAAMPGQTVMGPYRWRHLAVREQTPY